MPTRGGPDNRALTRGRQSSSVSARPSVDERPVDFSPAWLLTSLLVSTVGLGFFLYGKKQTRLPQLVAGIVIMLESAFVPSPAWMVASAGVVLLALWALLRAGS